MYIRVVSLDSPSLNPPLRVHTLASNIERYQFPAWCQGVCRLHGICIDSLPNLYLVIEPVFGGTLEAYLQTVQSTGVPEVQIL